MPDGNRVQVCSVMTGTSIAIQRTVINFFMVGSERFTWELVSVDNSKACRLSISHSGGTIVEYFTSATAALQRQSELELLLTGTANHGASR